MTVSNIFKMEMFRNFRDKAYLIVIASIAGVGILTTVLGLIVGEYGGHSVALSSLLIFLIFSLVIGIPIFSVIYPWHLLSTDYNNKTLALVVASGVKRSNYYFVKMLATIVSSLLAYLVIGIFPVIILMGIYHDPFQEVLWEISKSLTSGFVWAYLFNMILSGIATIVVLYFVTIITRGKFWGIFVYFGIEMAVGIAISMIMTPIIVISAGSGSESSGLNGVLMMGYTSAIIQIVAFGLAGFFKIKKQDL